METTDKVRFGIALNAMAAIFQRDMTEAALTGYWMGLHDLPLEAIERAIEVAMRTRRFMPVVAEIRELAGFGEVALDDRATICWQVFTKTLRRHGYYHSVDFDDTGVNFAARSIGAWDEDFELTPYTEKRFREAYCAYHRTGAGDGSPVIGYYDRHNGANGYGVKEPLAIPCGLPVLLPRQTTSRPAIAADRLRLTEGVGKVVPE